MGELEQRMKLWASYGLKNQEMLDKNQLREHVNSDLYAGGLIDHSGGHMHPLNLALGEAAAVEQNGGIIYEMSPVIDVDHAAAHIGCYVAVFTQFVHAVFLQAVDELVNVFFAQLVINQVGFYAHGLEERLGFVDSGVGFLFCAALGNVPDPFGVLHQFVLLRCFAFPQHAGGCGVAGR
ncbi:FAD-dependent oxidoreductase [Marinobacter gelidimuriae]